VSLESKPFRIFQIIKLKIITMKVEYFVEPKIGSFIFSFGHPMKPFRINMVNDLLRAYGLENWLNIKKGKNISFEEIENFHNEKHIFDLFRRNKKNNFHEIENSFPSYNGEDCPIFSGLTEFVNSYTKTSLTAALELSKKNTEIAINWSGGFHHAKSVGSSGFCYVNDIIISILELLKTFKRILYVDIDAHHGDGVEEAFFLSKRVLCLSFHNYKKFFFPETGCPSNNGFGLGKNFSFNFPLKPGLKDLSFEDLFKPIIQELMIRFNPEIIVFQSGADSLSKDPLGKFNLSIKGHGICIEFLKNTKIPLLVLGGGGYKISNVSRCWVYETSLLLNKKLSPKIPFNFYWHRYRGFFHLNFKISKISDKNSKKNLLFLREKILRNIRKLKINKCIF
jgi:acetoin utilization deacetylase AcuC-like enzyme